MGISVRMVGGPYDGLWYQIESLSELKVLEQVLPPVAYTRNDVESSAKGPETKTLPVRLTRNGYRAYWYERE